MNLAAIAWAAWVPVKRAEKLVAFGLAMRADADNLSSPSTRWLEEWSGMDRKTVRAALAELLRKRFIRDTGERRGQNGTRVVWAFSLEWVDADVIDFVKAGAQWGISPPIESGSMGDSTTHSMGENTTHSMGDSTTHPIYNNTTKVDSKNKVRGASRLPDDWSPPLADDLPTAIRDFVLTWPAGRYDRESGAFKDYWQAEGGAKARKHDWGRAFHTWLRRADDRITDRVSPPPGSKPNGAAAPVEVEGEPAPCADIRRALLADLEPATYGAWFGKVRLDLDGANLTVRGSSVVTSYIRDRYETQLRSAAAKTLGPVALAYATAH